MKALTPESHVFSFRSSHEAAMRMDPGQDLEIETLDCFSNQIVSEEQTIGDIDLGRVNPTTGPVYVDGARPGDLLRVSIEDIRTRDWGIVCTLPEIGVLQHTLDGRARTRRLPIKDGQVTFKDFEFPSLPMIGVIGVAPAEGEVVNGQPGDHGGNMDNHLITAGSRVYFPVQVPGALFALGDLHASMGDGEICGTGVETAGTVRLRLDVGERPAALDLPLVETDDAWWVVASADELDEAIEKASRSMQRLLMQAWGLDEVDAFLYQSIQGDLHICQYCKPSPFRVVVRFGIRKVNGRPPIVPVR
ncbi:MAG: acetamidase/formamidase family protein [Thermaerobacter sp.]|nr:acetamidase/formamidase family protein [Thermaerobacter sp.]